MKGAVVGVTIACRVALVRVLFVWASACLGLAVFVAATPTLWAQTQTQTRAAREDVLSAREEMSDLRIQVVRMEGTLSILGAQLNDVKSQMTDVQDTQAKTMLAVIGLLMATVTGLIGVLWNLRGGWVSRAQGGG